jgi:hypothetical protein
MTLLWTITCKSERRSKQEKEKERDRERQGRVELVKETGDVSASFDYRHQNGVWSGVWEERERSMLCKVTVQ